MRQTTRDIASILKTRNLDGRYDAIIQRAENDGYHDFKFDRVAEHPEYGECICPKVQLVEDLAAFPELSDIREQVMNGAFDESMDDDDKSAMRESLIKDGTSDMFFEMMGLTPPTHAERIKTRLKNN